MQYTENYDLPIIEGTDIPNYAPFNEGMNKIDEALNDMGTDVTEAVANTNQAVQEVRDEMGDLSDAVTGELEQTKTDITNQVNDTLVDFPIYLLAGRLNTPANYQICGDTGNDVLPLSANEFMKIQNNGIVVEDNRFSNKSYKPHSSGTISRYVKLSVDLLVGANEGDILGVYLAQTTPTGSTTIKNNSYTLKQGMNEIHFTCIFNMNSIDNGITAYKYIGLDSANSLTLGQKTDVTIEYLGIDD